LKIQRSCVNFPPNFEKENVVAKFIIEQTNKMGIHGLTKLLSDNCPSAMKEEEIKNYFGRKLAIDASMSLYQFLIGNFYRILIIQ
jgi:hypothetical protein